MTFNEKATLVALACAAALVILFVTQPVKAQSTIAVITPEVPAGRWYAEQGFIVTSPAGERFACQIGIWTPEFEPDEVSLECAPFPLYPDRYKGHKDGELELVE